MGLSRDDVKQLLVSLLPQGSEQLYALRNGNYIGGLFYGLAEVVKAYGLDRLEQLRLEVNPSTIVENIPDWEAACGLTNTPIARFGTLDQRRNAILGILRSHGSFSLDDIRAAVQPFFLYQDPSQIEILETDRAALKALHSYTTGVGSTIGPNSSTSSSVTVLDDPRVSPAGAQVNINLTTDFLEDLTFRLTGPDGTQKTWLGSSLGTGAVTTEIYTLWAPEFAGHAIKGSWTFRMATGPLATATLDDWYVFVEGLGVVYDTAMPPNRIGQGLGAPMFEFAVIADPALLGMGYDLVGAQKAVNRIKPAHTIGNIVIKNVVAGLCAIPDEPETIPDACIPCN